MIKEIQGSLLESTTKYIAHQTNCYSVGSSGLARSIFLAYPYADSYKKRYNGSSSKPGTIDVFGNGESERYVINMNAQIYPGAVSRFTDDTPGREKYFRECLKQIEAIPDLISIAFPYNIGCGLACGYWPSYLKMLQKFEESVCKSQGTQVIIYKLPE